MRSWMETRSDATIREEKKAVAIGKYEDLLKRKKVLITLANADVAKRNQYDNAIHNVTRAMQVIREKYPEHKWEKYDG